MPSPRNRRFSTILAAALAIALAFLLWRQFQAEELPYGIASSNGRIEALEIDIAAVFSGRIAEVHVREGDKVHRGDVLATMDTASLRAQLREAEAQLQSAMTSIETAGSQVRQREAECDAAEAVVSQREAELSAARKRLERTESLASRGIATRQTLDDDSAHVASAKAAVRAAVAQVAAAEAACGYARAQVSAARSAVEAASATIERIEADINDAVLKSPRDGRVQYLVAQPGEVVSPGGVVLNMLDTSDVYMTFFLPTEQAGQLAIGSEARIVLDAFPDRVIPATITFVADTAQFTPKTVETQEERQKLMFRIRATLDGDVLREFLPYVKAGLPGMAYVRVDGRDQWPVGLQVAKP